jgi:serine/threonine protein kinase
MLFRRYRVLQELGRGGVGVVYLTQDTGLEIPVAVKVLPDYAVKDPEAIRGVRKEVLRGMALTHSGIVRTHNFESDETSAGIVMEYVKGDTLADLKHSQRGGCYDPAQILPWIEQICAVLEYAHREASIVHRDLKPRNIMVTQSGKVKVADFGISAVLGDTVSRHTLEGTVSGTVSYMSPQQAEGRRPSYLDDMHALGATIYELLTGKPPFFRGSQAAIFHQVLCVCPPSMAERRQEFEITGRVPIPGHWEEAVAACLAKNPAKRPQRPGDLLDLLKGTSSTTTVHHPWSAGLAAPSSLKPDAETRTLVATPAAEERPVSDASSKIAVPPVPAIGAHAPIAQPKRRSQTNIPLQNSRRHRDPWRQGRLRFSFRAN